VFSIFVQTTELKSRKLIIIARFFLIVPLLGVLSFSMMKMKWMNELHEKLESGLHREKLLTLCYSVDEYKQINWIGQREFIMDGQWYDVVKKQKTGDEYQLTVFPDHEEKNWFANFFPDNKSTSDHSGNFNQHNFKFSLFQNLVTQLKEFPKSKDRFVDITEMIPTVFFDKNDPPPRQIC
jgi:hypothetical protein